MSDYNSLDIPHFAALERCSHDYVLCKCIVNDAKPVLDQKQETILAWGELVLWK